MCTLAIYFQHTPALPLVVAANRDEFYARPTSEPRVIAHDPWVVAGQDLEAGGTWLGLNEHSMVVGLLNRRRPDGPDPARRSRGLLCLQALQTSSPGEALDFVRSHDPAAHNWFNLLIADAHEAWVVSNAADRLTVTALSPGLHLLTNLDLNDPTCPRIAKSFRLFEALPVDELASDLPRLLESLRQILSDHEVPLDPRWEGIGNTLCIHSPQYGTRSSSVLVHLPGERQMRYWHASGPPCRTQYVPVPLP